MSDYAISIRVRNARIRRKIAECGFRNVSELCRLAGLNPSAISALLNLRVPPLTHTGAWRRTALALAEVLGCTCEELFSVTQRTLVLRTNPRECTVTESELWKLCRRIERPLIEDPGERLLDDSDEYSKGAVVRRALDELRLTQRSRKIIEGYFGIDCDEKTLSDLALEFNVCRQAIEQSLNITLRRLGSRRSRSRRLLLQAYQPANAMGTADERRIRSAQQRASLLRTERERESRVRAQGNAPRPVRVALAT
jgi:transcriptional regulator with XRE-family HTH domain